MAEVLLNVMANEVAASMCKFDQIALDTRVQGTLCLFDMQLYVHVSHALGVTPSHDGSMNDVPCMFL